MIKANSFAHGLAISGPPRGTLRLALMLAQRRGPVYVRTPDSKSIQARTLQL